MGIELGKQFGSSAFRKREAAYSGLLGATLALLAGFAALLLIAPVYRMGLWLEQPNEGWNAIHALQAFGPELYPPRDGFVINNYPPLWFYLTGSLARIFGDPIFPGRVVALLALAGTATGIFALLRQLDATRTAAIVAALTFVVILAGLLTLYVGLSEPQMLAHALVTCGAAVVVGARTRRAATIAAFMTAAGLLTKHTAIALPLASLLWLWMFRRELLLTWIGTGLVIGLALFAVLLTLYGSNFIDNMLFPRILTLERLGTNLALVSKIAVPLVIYAMVAWRLRRAQDESMTFAGLAIAAGFAAIFVFGAALGVSINAVFDLVIAACIGLGVAWDRIKLLAGDRANLWRAAIVIALIARVAAGVSYDNVAIAWSAPLREQLRQQSATTLATRDVLRRASGPVACETLSTCVWAGHVSKVDLWKLRHESTLGPSMNTIDLLARIGAGRFGAVVTFGTVSSASDDRRLPGLFAALAQGYAPPIAFGKQASVFLPKPSR